MRKSIILTAAIVTFSLLAMAGEETKLMRFPDICGDRVVFVYAGDIWTVPASGGRAVRLTSHEGRELFPKISPDGKWIAFTAEYSGSRQVYVMPSEGGIPRQLTYYNDAGVMPPRGGFDYLVLDWTPDSSKILVRANRTPWGERMGKYYLVSLNGGLETALAIPEGGSGRFSPDGNQIVYTPIEREFRNWKRYKGGRAQDVWIYDLKKNQSRRLTDFPGTDQHPMWFGDRIYFVSDRDLVLNIYSYDLQNQKITQLTHHKEYDVLWPSGENGVMVYENGGELHRLDTRRGQSEKIPVEIAFDSSAHIPAIRNVKNFVQSYDISPTGKRAVFEARGDLFTVPAEEGITINLTRSQGVRELYPAWSPDGRWIAYYSDQSGEYEIYRVRSDGGAAPEQLTTGSRIWRFPPLWSPDSKKLLFSDKNQTLQVLDVDSRKIEEIYHSRLSDITDYRWSPDSNWILYTENAFSGQSAIQLYSLAEKKGFQMTDGTYNDYQPVFSRCGKYLFFLSDRDFNLAFSSFEFDYLYQRATRIYVLPLKADTPPLIPEKNDMEEIKTADASKSAGKEKKGGGDAGSPAKVEVDRENLLARLTALPLPAGNYNQIQALEKGLLFARDGEIRLFSFADKKDSLVMAKVRGGALSADGKKILYRSAGKFGIINAAPGQKPGSGLLKLDGLTMKIDPILEWKQIFLDGWRIFRDYFYVKNLHGVDWQKMKEKYGRLVPFLHHRADLDFLFSEMVAEVNSGHTYVNWGDFPQVKRIDTGLLGADLKADDSAGRYRITKIYKGENWNPETRSPLTEAGVDVHEGDYLISLNGENVSLSDNPYRFLENTVDRKISIKVNSMPKVEGAREYWIKPIRSELKLFYLDWVNSRREMVDRLSNGRIGYIHVPDTSVEGNRELFKGIYAYQNKEALIIDERYNGGGFIPAVMANMLGRETLNYWVRRGVDMQPDPFFAHDGPKAMLINGYSSSGGDAFPYYFKKLKLGTLIGTRTWGGLIGISGNPGFVDGGSFNVPTFGFVDTNGNWAVEGEGVSPDIEVIDLPEKISSGQDPGIEKAVEVLLNQLEKNPVKKLPNPSDPDRSKWIEKEIPQKQAD